MMTFYQLLQYSIFIIYHELEHLNICPDTVTDMNETLNTVAGYNSDAATDLGYEKNFHNYGCWNTPPLSRHPSPNYNWGTLGLNLKICKNFVRTKYFLTFVGG